MIFTRYTENMIKVADIITRFLPHKKQTPQKERKYADIPFQHLAPTDTVDDSAVFDALDYALSQQSIHNIAVTGNYGSGKSSVLTSYTKKYLKDEYLNISLATFAMEEANVDTTASSQGDKKSAGKLSEVSAITSDSSQPQQSNKKPDEELPETTVQKIEKSILQQIFYRMPGDKFPYSRFNRIKKLSFKKKCIIEFVILLLLLFPVKLLKNDIWIKVKEALSVSFAKESIQFGGGWVSFILGWLFVAAFLIVVYKIISFVNKIRLTKFSFQKAEFGLDDVKEESLLNRYIDEILYFFEVTKYKVVIIEDLDRFKNTEIFIKLRELNTLLNNYEKIERNIVFIYALRDEVFKDSSRTKFFEFIIPVIPVINCQNASDILLKAKSENPESVLKYIDENFLQDAGLYIDDMRLLKNCINEFIIYDRKINENDYKLVADEKTVCHDRNKILALILYKNLYPEDFAKLSRNEGELFEIFKKKNSIIQEKIEKISDEIPPLEKEIRDIESQAELDITELRLVYIAKIVSKKQDGDYIKDNLQELASDEKFSVLKNNTAFTSYYIYRSNYNSNTGSRSISYNFHEIENEVNPNYTYEQREQLIKDKKSRKVSELKALISKKKTLIASMTQMSMEELLKEKEISAAEFTGDVKNINADFIIFLLRNGYIDEDYFDYMSYFYPEALSQTDKNYLLLIKNQHPPMPEQVLNKVENVVKRIREAEWKLPAILNYSLFDYLLESSNKHLTDFVKVFYEYKKTHSDFVLLNRYLNREIHQRHYLYTELYGEFKQHKDWAKLLFEGEGKDSIYDFFVSVDVDASEKAYIDFLSNDVSFLHQNEENIVIGDKIKSLHLKFDLTEETPNYPVFAILLQNNAYNISQNNFDILLNALNKENQKSPITDYYHRVSQLSEKIDKKYITENIESFVTNVMLFGNKNVAECEGSFIELLNYDTLSDESKEELIKRNTNKISDITKILNAKMQSCLLNESKIIPSWKNVFEYFKSNENSLKESLIQFVNNGSNTDELVKEKVPLSDEERKNKNGNYEVVSAFYSEILHCNDLSLEAYSKLMNVCPWYYESLSVYDISYEKMKFLIKEKKISLTKENYTGVKENLPQLLPVFVSVRFSDFIKNDLDIEITGEDMLTLLNSDKITDEQKKQLVSADFDAWRNMTEQDSLAQVGKVIVKIHFSSQSAVSIGLVIDSMTSKADKIDILELQCKNMDSADVARIVAGFGSEYATITENKGQKPKIEKTNENERLVKVLENKKLISSFAIKENKIEIHQKKK